MRERFGGSLIYCGHYDAERAQQRLEENTADAIAFGRPFIANPDLPERLRLGASLNEPDQAPSTVEASRATPTIPSSTMGTITEPEGPRIFINVHQPGPCAGLIASRLWHDEAPGQGGISGGRRFIEWLEDVICSITNASVGRGRIGHHGDLARG